MDQRAYDSARLTQHCAGASAIGLLTSLLRHNEVPPHAKPAAEAYVRAWDEADAQMAKAIEEMA